MSELTAVSATGDVVRVITLDGPKRRNALATSTVEDLDAAISTAFDDDGVRAIVLTGAGGFFCAGADLKSPRANGKGVGAPASRLSRIHHILDMLHRRPKPVVAAVEGGAVGVGWSFVLACDFTIAAQDAYFLAPFTERGLVPDGGIAWFLSRAIGRQRAAFLLMLGERLHAAEALGLGLVNEIVPPGEALSIAVEMAQALALAAPDATALTKMLLGAAESSASYRDFLDHEWVTAALALHGPDAAEGLLAFVERRRPDFRGGVK